MTVLLFVFACVIVSIGLILCAVALRSTSLAKLNTCIWFLVTFAVLPWNTLTTVVPKTSEERLDWNAALVWAVFFGISLITLAYCLISTHIAKKPPKRRRRRSRGRREGGDGNATVAPPSAETPSSTEDSQASAWRV